MLYRKGFTLMEVLISAVLISIALVGLTSLFVAGKRHILHSRSRMTAGELGKYFLDPLQMQVRQDEWGSNCLSVATGCDTTPQTINNITYTPTYSLNDASGTTLRRVKVMLTWSEPSP